MAVLFWRAFERIHLQPVHASVVVPLLVHDRPEGALTSASRPGQMFLVPRHVATNGFGRDELNSVVGKSGFWLENWSASLLMGAPRCSHSAAACRKQPALLRRWQDASRGFASAQQTAAKGRAVDDADAFLPSPSAAVRARACPAACSGCGPSAASAGSVLKMRCQRSMG